MMKRISNAKGSNEGGFFENAAGERFYVKFYRNTNQAYAEAIANMIYNLVGINAPVSTIETIEGKTAIKSKVVKGNVLGFNFSKEIATEICKGFLVDAFLANYDFAGLVNDNILVNGNDVIRIDNGSAFMFRAMGSLKDSSVLYKLDELNTFFEKGQFPQFLGKAGISKSNLDIRKMAEKLLAIDYALEIGKRFPNYDATAFLSMINARLAILKTLV